MSLTSARLNVGRLDRFRLNLDVVEVAPEQWYPAYPDRTAHCWVHQWPVTPGLPTYTEPYLFANTAGVVGQVSSIRRRQLVSAAHSLGYSVEPVEPVMIPTGGVVGQVSSIRRRLLVSAAHYQGQTVEPVLTPHFDPHWALNVNRTVGINIEPK
jgi:hypothetical protein